MNPATETQVPDGDLVRRISQRDEAALSLLYDRYSALLYSVALRILRDSGAAEEILQDIFYQLWSTAAQFDPQRGTLAAWLVVITRNRAISRLRRRNPGSEDPEDRAAQFSAQLPFEVEASLFRGDLLSRVRKAVEVLPGAQRQALELAYFEGMTHSEIARKTGEPLGTVKTRLRSAVETLRQAFAK